MMRRMSEQLGYCHFLLANAVMGEDPPWKSYNNGWDAEFATADENVNFSDNCDDESALEGCWSGYEEELFQKKQTAFGAMMHQKGFYLKEGRVL